MPKLLPSVWGLRGPLAFTLLLGLSPLLAPRMLYGQGMIGRGATAMPKPKPSGRVFPSEFADVAAAAGLTAPQISGADKQKYIIESIGTGVAFLDYDNDDWPDCLASTILPGQRQLFFPTGDNYQLCKAALLA